MKVVRFLFIFLSLTHSAMAMKAEPHCLDTEFGKSLVTLEQQSLLNPPPTLQDWLAPILNETKSPELENSIDEIELNAQFQSYTRTKIKKLVKNKCIERVTGLIQLNILKYISFTNINQISIDQNIQNLPNPSTYLFNQNAYIQNAQAKLSAQDFVAWMKSMNVIDLQIGKSKSPIGKLWISEKILLYFTRPEINLLSNLMNESITILSATNASINIDSKITHSQMDIGLSSTDLANLSKRYLNRELNSMNTNSSFKYKRVSKEDVLVSALLTHTIDAKSALVFLRDQDFISKKHSLLLRSLKISINAAKVIITQIPAVIPFVTFGTLFQEAIKTKKELERKKADDANLIPSR